MMFRAVMGPARDLLQRQLERPPVRRVLHRTAARLRDVSHRLEGLAYRVADRHPDPDVGDEVLTQRIRSQLGPVEQRLDVPRPNVTVVDHVAEIRGVVGTRQQAQALIDAVGEVSGVRDVRAVLHVGYGPGDTTPSEGRRHRAPSQAWRDLVGSVREFGEPEETAEVVTTMVLATLLDVLPTGERAHLRSHLTTDVKEHVDGLVRVGHPPRPRSREEFVAAVTAGCGVPRDTAETAVRQVLATLQELVPEEKADIEAVLPGDLKDLWRRPLATAPG